MDSEVYQESRLGMFVRNISTGLTVQQLTCGINVVVGTFPAKPLISTPWLYGDLTIMLYGDNTEMITYA